MTYWTRKLSILPSQTKIVMKPFLRHLVLVLLSVTFMLPAFFLSSESVNERSFKRDRDGIQVFTRRVESSKNKAMNATMSIQAPVHAAVALVRDTDASAEWAVLCKESYKDEVVSEKELNVYTTTIFPGRCPTEIHSLMSSGISMRKRTLSQCW